MTHKLEIQPYPKGTPHQLHELASKLPAGAEVICESEFINIFQNVYARNWSCEDNALPPLIITKPLLYIHDKKLNKSGDCYDVPKSGYVSIPNPELLILADSSWYSR